jgi:hypothetical protein
MGNQMSALKKWRLAGRYTLGTVSALLALSSVFTIRIPFLTAFPPKYTYQRPLFDLPGALFILLAALAFFYQPVINWLKIITIKKIKLQGLELELEYAGKQLEEVGDAADAKVVTLAVIRLFDRQMESVLGRLQQRIACHPEFSNLPPDDLHIINNDAARAASLLLAYNYLRPEMALTVLTLHKIATMIADDVDKIQLREMIKAVSLAVMLEHKLPPPNASGFA